MCCIYMIKNKISGKIYIGQTSTTLKMRMSRHFTVANCNANATGIDGAIRKYGKDNFSAEVICECNKEELNEKEKHYISLFQSNNRKKGYNLTVGGQDWSGLHLDEKEVINKYNELHSINDTAAYYNCCIRCISDILHKHNVYIYKPKGKIENLRPDIGPTKPIKINELDIHFKSIKECAEWFIKKDYCKVKILKYAMKGICNALKNKRKTYHSFTFSYI